ncbi:MAG: phage protein GemA/Gp16 family protein [Nitrospirota bacterium]
MAMNTATNHDLKIRKRVQLVHIAANELGLLDPKKHDTDPDDEYHTILKRWNRPGTRQPVTSSLQMSYQQLGELLDFMTALGFKLKSKGPGSGVQGPVHPSPQPSPPRVEGTSKKYASSLDGLREEITDLARERWGDSWEQSLNKLCRKFGVSHWRFLNVNHGKAVKQRIESWQQGEAETV